MRDFVTFTREIKLRISERLSRVPRSGSPFVVAIGDYEDPRGRIGMARARQLFWFAFAIEAPHAIRELFDESALAAVNAFPLESNSLVTLHLDPWWERYNLRKADGFDRLRSDVIGAVCAEESWSPEHIPARINGEALILRTSPGAVLDAYHDHALSGLLCFGNRECLFDLDVPLDISIQFEDNDPESADGGGCIMGWNPVFETRAAARARHLETFEALLDEALDKREQEALNRGLVKATHSKRSTNHFRWLVRYQCLAQSYSAIARDTGKTPKTITDGVADAAALLGITIREPMHRGGRPRKAA